MSVVSKQKQPAYKCGYYIGSCEVKCRDGSICCNSGQYYLVFNDKVFVACSLHKKWVEKAGTADIRERPRDVSDNPLYQHYYGDGRRMRGFDPNKRQVLN